MLTTGLCRRWNDESKPEGRSSRQAKVESLKSPIARGWLRQADRKGKIAFLWGRVRLCGRTLRQQLFYLGPGQCNRQERVYLDKAQGKERAERTLLQEH